MRSYVNVDDAAEYLGTSVRFIRRLINERRIRFYRVGRHVRLSLVDLEQFVQSGKVEPIDRCKGRGVKEVA